MKTMNYVSPQVVLVEVMVEQGFAMSQTGVSTEEGVWDDEIIF